MCSRGHLSLFISKIYEKENDKGVKISVSKINLKTVMQKSTRLLCFLVAAAVAVGYLYSYLNIVQFELEVTEYNLTSEKAEVPFKIAVVADLHNHEYGEQNIELLNRIKESNPDLIAVVGDIVMKDSDNTSVLESVMKALAKIAPTYFCLGNHELELVNRGIDIEGIVEASGAVFLDNGMTEVEINGVSAVIGGLTYNPDYGTPSLEFLEEFAAREEYKLLLCHYPEYQWMFMKYDIDLALCGHLHGGLIRIPGIGPIYTPTQKFFPKYTEGVHESETAAMVVSRGLGVSSFIPRINNPTELVCVNVTDED